ncbi:MAG: hypothetical protein H6Q86_5756 [candidate division NC10 bacterium]|nr:hypothetical protein [candidate division NC10 bacterium]
MTGASRLTPLQHALLEGFFRLSEEFFLTGGAALAGFHLGHRQTHDLDFFTVSGDLESGVRALRAAAAHLGAAFVETRTSPDFRRLVVSGRDESLIVDLVFERAPQIHGEKLVVGGIRIDPVDEIFANKLCALLGRAEVRDLVDLFFLEPGGRAAQGRGADAGPACVGPVGDGAAGIRGDTGGGPACRAGSVPPGPHRPFACARQSDRRTASDERHTGTARWLFFRSGQRVELAGDAPPELTARLDAELNEGFGRTGGADGPEHQPG